MFLHFSLGRSGWSKRVLFIFTLVLSSFAAGCGGQAVSRVSVAMPNNQPTSGPLPSVVVTLLPAGTSTPTGGPPAVENPPSEAYPSPVDANSTPVETPTLAAPPDQQPELAVNQSQPWQDCALTPGWAACDPSVPIIQANLALVQPGGPSLAALDLAGQDGWQVNIHPQWVGWSPDGSRLLVGLNDQQYAIFSATGQLQETFTDPYDPRWQPDNTVGKDGHIHSAQGDDAWFEVTADGRWNLHVLPAAQTAEKTLEIESQPTDKLYQLVSWVPGKQQVLAVYYYADNAAMVQGGTLILIDTQTGRLQPMAESDHAMTPLGWRRVLSWNPKAAVLAYTDLRVASSPYPTLALMDFSIGQIRLPLPEGVQVSGLSWDSAGEKLAFAGIPQADLSPADAEANYPLPAIYVLSPTTGEVKLLTHPPDGARDSLPRWSADGSILLYARWFDSGALEVRAMRLSDGKDWVILSGLPAQCESSSLGCDWQSWVSFQVK